MLDHIERGRFLIEPAGEDPLELILRVANVHLHEGARQLLDLPGSRGFACAKANDHVVHPDRLPWLQRQVPRNAVALVKEAEHRHPLGHRRGAGRRFSDRLRNVDRLRLRLSVRRRLPLGHSAVARAKKRQSSKEVEASH
jgi:hypothetical protein